MKRIVYYLITFILIIGLGIILWPETDQDEISASISAAEAISGDNHEGYLRVTEPRELTFPNDHGPHPGYRTEWWYYTGNLFTDKGRQFGYQFTIFRNQLSPPGNSDDIETDTSNWKTDQLYFAHFAIADVVNNEHRFEERYSRGALGLAGAEAAPYRIWLEDWKVVRTDTGESEDKNFPVHIKTEMEDGSAVDLDLRPAKPLVKHGDRGYDVKGPGEGNASYYLSFTRMNTDGVIILDGKKFNVTGLSWMDHEWSTSVLDEDQIGWDWFSIQLSNGYDLMYYQLRNEDGSASEFSSGTLVEPEGNKRNLTHEDVTLEVLDRWRSPHTGSVYPTQWSLHIPNEGLTLDMHTLFDDQEMTVSIVYYEGAISVSGSMEGAEISGYGFVEMTGYKND
ncbi:MAG: lipocalin-like domain-containing protein [Balneolaceae bacterium]